MQFENRDALTFFYANLRFCRFLRFDDRPCWGSNVAKTSEIRAKDILNVKFETYSKKNVPYTPPEPKIEQMAITDIFSTKIFDFHPSGPYFTFHASEVLGLKMGQK